MTKHKIHLGQHGEELASNFLEERGYKILERNFKTRLGEIDIVASDNDTVCFIEVKTRTQTIFGTPFEAITRRKQRKLTQLALLYLKERNWMDKKARFDIVAITQDDQLGERVEILENAFECSNGYFY